MAQRLTIPSRGEPRCASRDVRHPSNVNAGVNNGALSVTRSRGGTRRRTGTSLSAMGTLAPTSTKRTR